jgi:Raf kinase inhibitor-like YbhB/YbcL family protein
MKIYSKDFQHGGMIPRIFTCQGKNINPQVAWSGVPPEAKSLALIVDDPDAPMGTWVHWLICDIDPSYAGIDRESVPRGAMQVNNDFRKPDYGGPCPPSGIHRYFFKLYALKVKKLGANNKRTFYKLVKSHAMARAVLMGKYTKG